jgi:tagatose 1,6-diphosphate aldolase
MITPGEFRRLSQCGDEAGTFCILAIDHRDNLIAELQKGRNEPVERATVVAFKSAVLHAAGAASAVLLDPDYGMPAVMDGLVPAHIGLLAPLEITDYRPHPRERQPRLIPEWDVQKLARAGFSGAKLLLYFHPDAGDAAEKTAFVDRMIEECCAHEVPLFLEPIAYSLDPARPLNAPERRQVVVASARHFSPRGAAVLKLEFPVNVVAQPDERAWDDGLKN